MDGEFDLSAWDTITRLSKNYSSRIVMKSNWNLGEITTIPLIIDFWQLNSKKNTVRFRNVHTAMKITSLVKQKWYCDFKQSTCSTSLSKHSLSLLLMFPKALRLISLAIIAITPAMFLKHSVLLRILLVDKRNRLLCIRQSKKINYPYIIRSEGVQLEPVRQILHLLYSNWSVSD